MALDKLLNSNIRCIEIMLALYFRRYLCWLNSNIRCIEMFLSGNFKLINVC